MKIKKTQISFFPSLLLCVFFLLTLSFCTKAESPKQDYGIFLGMDTKDLHKLKDYKMVILEPSNFSAEQIKEIKERGTKVYGYLNIGSLENFRPYYEQFKKHTMAPYENWEEEYWIDVSDKEWQDHLTQVLAKNLADKGVDGFFLDNADVWYFYPEEKIYTGLADILQQLKQEYKLPIIINGGDTFVSTLIDSDKTDLIDGINQETVFTSIDFEHKTFGKQEPEQTKYLWDYLMKCQKAGLSVYLLEYGEDKLLQKKIQNECEQSGFEYYISPSLELR